ncbi:OmpA family protein [Azospirillum sp. A1-3]|uniref:OmpA family protein n=1 Tax=Azospirillum sp. A1-3 TaxID=185874 RepID=UPI0020771C0D|nr:OmpA family protein [Azospirillum sp. A1-3]MCM8738870.1 OmpA family protein [Azospirillum sp. A1-3]
MKRVLITVLAVGALVFAAERPARAADGDTMLYSDIIRSLTPKPRSSGKMRGLALGTGVAAPAPARAVLPKISLQVEFNFNSATLSPKATAQLNELGQALTSSELSGYRFQLTGHTDAVGKAEYNLALSQRRAQAVRDYLAKEFGIRRDRLKTAGRGSQQLADPSDPTSQINRRVEIINLGG